MKKRFLSLLTALCLMLSLAPAAFAAEMSQPDTITLPNGEVREIPDITPADAPMSMSSNSTSGTTITITSETQFAGIDAATWYGGNTFRIACDLDMTKIATPSEWYGYIQYFYGNMEGVKGIYDDSGEERYPIISGIANNRSLIYGIIGGTIQNLTFEHDATTESGSASFITFMPVNLSGVSYHLTMTNVTVTGSISLTGSDQSNYAPFVYVAPGGGLTMNNCVNEASITGSIYGSVFHGYYPLTTGESCKYVFSNCVNNGDVTMQYAGMFFGNSSSLEGKVSSDALYLTITGCQNNGTIRGTSGAKYFAAPVSEFGTNMDAVETILEPVINSGNTTNAIGYINVQRITGTGALCERNPLAGFSASLAGNTLTVNRATDETDIDHYTVAISGYVHLWDTTEGAFIGTDRYTAKQDIGLSSITGSSFQPALRVYGFADSNAGSAAGSIAGNVLRRVNGALYYAIADHFKDTGYSLYVSTELADGEPVGGGTTVASIVTVAAYDQYGVMLDCITVPLS